MMRSDIGFIYCMCFKMQMALETLDEVEQLYARVEGQRASRILYPDMVQLAHIINQLREMSSYWEDVIDLLDREELEKWQKASLRDAGEKEKEG